MIKIRRSTSAIVVGVAAVLAIGGTAALAAGAADPASSPSSDDRGTVPLLPVGDPPPTSSIDDSTPAPSPSTWSPTAPAGAVPPARSALSIGVARAEAIAIRTAGGGRITRVESEFEHGRSVWKVEVLLAGVRHRVDVDKATGTVTRHRIDGVSGGGVSGSGVSGSSVSGSGVSGSGVSGSGGPGGSDDPANHDVNDDHGGGGNSGSGHGSDG